MFDMFNFLASKHRQPPEYRPQEDDDDEGQLRTARSVTAHTKSFLFIHCEYFFLLLEYLNPPHMDHSHLNRS